MYIYRVWKHVIFIAGILCPIIGTTGENYSDKIQNLIES